MGKRIPRDVEEAMEELEKRGYSVYIVGGAVRDLLRGVEPNDYDLATSARPEEVLRVFREKGWVVVPKGVQYGVVSVVHPATGREIEIATFRKEYYPLDYARRNAVVEYADSIEDDLARRDFTINAMAMDREGNIVDPFGGRKDLGRGVIRFVGEPSERIREDPLRMLRAVRFASKMGFEIEPESYEALRENWEKLGYVSRERIGEEVKKAMKGVAPEKFPQLLYATELYRVVYPELGDMAETRHGVGKSHYGETVLEHTSDVMERAKVVEPVEEKPVFMMGAMLHDVGKPYTAEKRENGWVSFPRHDVVGSEIAEKRMREWRRPVREINYVVKIVRNHMTPLNLSNTYSGKQLAAKMLAKYGYPLAYDLALHAYADTGDEYWLDIANIVKQEGTKARPLVNGYDIIQYLGVKPGPVVGELKKKAYEIQVNKNINDKEKILEELRKLLSKKKITL